ASQTRPLSVSGVKIFSDSLFTSQLSEKADYAATGTIYLEFSGVDGANLTRDYAIASISNGNLVYLTETASASAVYRGSYSFTNLSDRFNLIVQSVKSPAASASLLITYPSLSPTSPASASTNVSVGSNIVITADEPVDNAQINAANVKLMLGGSQISSSLSYNAATRQITIDPDQPLTGQQTYQVQVSNQKDLSGNPQLSPLIFNFTTEDNIPPTITSFFPAQNQTGVTIEQILQVDFSENILPASIGPATVKLTRGGISANYNLNLSGNKLTIDPQDSSENYLLTATSYVLEIGPSVKDLAGNSLSNVPATFTLNFSTQPTITGPTTINSLTIFKDALYLEGWSQNEKVPASATIYIKMVGTDGATQTRDIATATLNLSWAGIQTISLNETASNSTGFYLGQFNLGSIPIFGFPNPLPPVSIGSLTFASEIAPAQAATLSLRFPDILPSSTLVNSTNGQVGAANATNVRIDTSIVTTFNDALLQAGSSTSFSVASGGTAISGTRLLSADGTRITFVPASTLPFSSQITVSGGYSETGLKSKIGNPLYRSFSYSFTTQASQTQPLAINRLDLFKAGDYSAVSAYESNSDFPGSGIVYVEIAGTDGSSNTIDSTQAQINTGGSLTLNETSASSGVYRGQYSYSNLSDGTVLRISSALNSAASQTLVLSYPELSQIQPASGAANVSVFGSIFIKSSESLQSGLVNAGNVKLLKNGISEVSSNISWNSALSQIEITPTATLDYSSNYLISVNGQKDLVGNNQKNQFLAAFSTQATSVAPTIVTGIKVFSDSTFTTQIADNSLVAPATQIYIEVTATDQSTTTIDSTNIQMTSNLTAASSQLALIETGNNTGIFRGTIQLFNEENATISITSLTNPGIFSRVRTFGLPTITSFQPASGSTSIFLDTRFTIKTSKAVDSSTLSTTSVIISDSTGIASFLPSLANSNEILVYSRLAKNSNVNLKISSLLKDSDGISFPLTIAEFKSVNPQISSLRLYSDAGLTSQLADNSQVEANQTIWARIDATDALNFSTEQQNLLVSLPTSTSTVALSESSPGIFTGSFIVPAAPGESLVMNPAENMAITSRLQILPDFAILSVNPASGAVSVAADVWPSWYFSRPVNPADATTVNFKLIKISDGSLVAGKVSQSPTTRQIRFQPDNILQLLSEYEMVADAGIRDENNKLLGTTFRTRFVSQPPPPPPTVISSFENFEADDYATATRVVATNGTLYLKMVANDVSFSTYEKARVRIDASDGSIDGQELVLVEVSPPSGIFTLALPVDLKPGTVLTLQPQVAPARVITVTAHPRTLLTSVDPASGSANLLLDSAIALRFSQSLFAASVASGVKIVADRDYAFTSTVDSTGQNLILTPTTGFATGAAHLIKIDTSLKDSNGLFLLPTNIGFSTIGEDLAGFELYTGLPPRQGQPVSQTGEAINGEISIIATTTNLFASGNEKRTLVIQAATQTFSLQLEESAIAGSFAGNFQPPAGISQSGLVASLSFAGKPTMTFNLAPTPEILETFPASNALTISEMPVISASFSRKMAFDAGQVLVDYPGGQAGTILRSTTDSTALYWEPTVSLPLQASCSMIFSGLTDYLGQPMPTRVISFSTGGLQGINLYRDDAFNLRIASAQIELPIAYAEIAASSPTGLQGRTFNLMVRSGTRATATVSLPLIPSSSGSGRFRCRLDFEPVKNLPGYNVPLLPGEWLELSSPILTTDRKVYYYRFSGAASPIKIHQIRFFQEKDFAQELHGILPLATFYLQVEADDLNWFTTDVTMVKITSDADKSGFTMPLIESGT
ncbi:MAG: Ig-like domain-containing protein, partial [Candidatus Rifleibacteriota bacterium]